jgi:hypothetical protein
MTVRSLGELALPGTARPPPDGPHALASPAPGTSPPREGPSFASFVDALSKESDRGESLVRRAVSGRGMEPGQLLALQAGIYRYGEVVDLATKLVDRASTGAKTVLQGQ